MKYLLLTLLCITLTSPALLAQPDCPKVDCTGDCGRFLDVNQDGFCDHGLLSNTDAEKDDNSTENKVVTEEPDFTKNSKEPFRYPVFSIVGALIAIYLLTLFLVKKQVITKPTHRKIWNVALAATCFISCLLGVLLALFINYNYRPSGYITFLHWHVYVGIAMTIIAIFHFLWHWGYYKAIVKNSKK